MIYAYDKVYLRIAQRSLGEMLSYAVYDLGYELEDYYKIFLQKSQWKRKYLIIKYLTLSNIVKFCCKLYSAKQLFTSSQFGADTKYIHCRLKLIIRWE